MGNKDELRKEIRKRFGNSKKSQSEIEDELQKYASDEPALRLELTYDKDSNILSLDANAEALRYLQRILGKLAELKPGSSIDFDEHTSLTKTNVRFFIIRHVEDGISIDSNADNLEA